MHMHISRNPKWLDVITLTQFPCEIQTQVDKAKLGCQTVADVAGLVVEVALLGDEDGILSLSAMAVGSGIGHSVAEASFTFSGAALSVGRQSIAAFCCRHRSSCRRRQAAGERCDVPACLYVRNHDGQCGNHHDHHHSLLHRHSACCNPSNARDETKFISCRWKQLVDVCVCKGGGIVVSRMGCRGSSYTIHWSSCIEYCWLR